MVPSSEGEPQPAFSDSAQGLAAFLLTASQNELGTWLERHDPDEAHLCLLLTRKELGGELLEQISRRREWLFSPRVRCELVAHPHTPRRVAIRLARELYVMDLLAMSLRPSAPAEVRRFATEMLLARVPHLPLGQKLAVARRAPARVAGAMLADANERLVRAALDNASLTEAQLLRALGEESLPESTVALVARHAQWSLLPTVRVALVRHPHAALADVFALIAGLPRADLIALERLARLRAEVHDAIVRELAARRE